MSASIPFSPEKRRETALLLELAGLMHDIGKLSDQFIAKQVDHSVEYQDGLRADPRKVFAGVTGTDPASKAITQLMEDADSQQGAPFKERPKLTDLFNRIEIDVGDGAKYRLSELLLLCKPRFGIDKNSGKLKFDWAEATGKKMGPAVLIGFLHGLAHFEKEAPSGGSTRYASSPFGFEAELPGGSEGLSAALQKLPLDSMSKILDSESNAREKWLNEIKDLLERGLADTRRPINEVSLWDWGFLVASLVKASANRLLSDGWPENLEELPDRLYWNTLRVNFDTLAAYERADKIGDLLGIQSKLQQAFRKARQLLEGKNALGNEIYHDETGGYFLVSLPGLSPELVQSIQDQFPRDLKPIVALGEQVTPGELEPERNHYDPAMIQKLLAEPRQEAGADLQNPIRSKDNLYTWEEEWAEAGGSEVCTVCGLRPVMKLPLRRNQEEPGTGNPAEGMKKRNVCSCCLSRRTGRAREWANNVLSSTIWTDEVADENGRLALMVGWFDLDRWLDGTLVQTLKASKSSTKNPSPARLYRIWQTTKAFWDNTLINTIPEVIGRQPHRLEIIPSDSIKSELSKKLDPYQACELNLEDIQLNLVWDPENGRFITIENLGYFLKRWKPEQEDRSIDLLSRDLVGEWDLLEPSTYGSKKETLGRIGIKDVVRLDGFTPAINILSEPAMMMTLIPAKKAIEAINVILKKYETEMGKVRDRLPLHLGLVFFPRRTPIRAVLAAGRRLLDLKQGLERWEIAGVTNGSPEGKKVIWANGIRWNVPLKMGDENTDDIWYPNLLKRNIPENGDLDIFLAANLREDRDEAGKLRKIKPAEAAWVFPSTFDFEFLDTSGRRFEIAYGPDGRRQLRKNRPYKLEEIHKMEQLWAELQGLDRSQIDNLVRSIEDTRQRWSPDEADEVFHQFVSDAFANANWKGRSWKSRTPEERQNLIQAGVTGLLADVFEIHLQILKDRPQNEQGD